MVDAKLRLLVTAEDWEPFNSAVAYAVNSGAEGEAILIRLISNPAIPDWKRAAAIGALGECDGPQGVHVLQSVAEDDENDWEMRYPALVGLAQRVGADASDVFARCLNDVDSAIQDCAARALAFIGNGHYWDAMWKRLVGLLSGPPPINPGSQIQLPGQAPKLITIVYLARYAATVEKRRQLIDLVHTRWDRLLVQEQEWLSFAWPAINPDDVTQSPAVEPDWKSMVDWVAHPIFDTVYAPRP